MFIRNQMVWIILCQKADGYSDGLPSTCLRPTSWEFTCFLYFQGTEQLQIKKKLPREITRNGTSICFGIIEKSVTLTEQGYVK